MTEDQGKTCILIVDDDPRMCRLLSEFWARRGYVTGCATGGSEALERLRAGMAGDAQSIDLVMLDIMMPGMDGIETCRRIRNDLGLASLPIIMLTARNTTSDRLDSLEAGANDYLTKPFDLRELQARVQIWIKLQQEMRRRADAEASLLRRHQELAAIYAVSEAVGKGLELEDMLSAGLSAALDAMSLDAGCIYLIDRDTTQVELRVSQGMPSRLLEGATRRRLCDVVSAAGNGEPVVIEDLLQPPSTGTDDYADLADAGLRTVAGAPIRTSAGEAGTLVVASRTVRAFEPAEIRLLRAVARELEAGIERVEHFAVARRMAREWEATFASIADGISVHDEALRIVRANPALARTLGATADDLTGQDGEQVFADWYGDGSPTPLRLGLSAVQTFQVENPGRLIGFFQVTVYPMGRVGAVQIIQDITEEKEMQAGLIQAEKMAVLGRMSASLAHEVSNPLQALRSGLSLLLKPSLEEDKRRHYLNIAAAEVRRLIAIVDRMVNFYRPSADVYANTDLNSLLREVLTLAEEELQRHRVRITCQFDEDLPKLQLVSDQIRQVFLNIILNAVEAMPGGGRLTVSTVQTSSEVQISFSDTGVGMEPAVLAKIFDPFYTTKETGTGLGLSISCRIVERHGGQLQVSSEVGEGSVFTVCLPLLRVNHEAGIPEP